MTKEIAIKEELVKCRDQSQRLRAVVLNPPNAATLCYNSLCCGDLTIIKLFLWLLHTCSLATAVNHAVNIFGDVDKH